MVSPASIGSPEVASGMTSETYFSPNSVLGTIEPVTSAGIVSVCSGKMPEGQHGAVVGGLHLQDLADDDAADLDVGAVGQLQADLRGLEA